MTLRWKTILVIGITFAALLGILFVVWQTILVRRFTELENQNTSQNTERAMNAVRQDIDSVSTAAADWGIWDDTYQFAQDGNQGYIDANFQDSSFTSIQMNLILIIDSSGQVLHGEAFDLQNQVAVPIPASLEENLSADSPLMQHTDEKSVSGIVILPEGPMLIASQPILNSEGDGPVQGTLIMGRYFDSAEIARLAILTNLSLAYYQSNDTDLPTDFKVAQSSLSEETPIFTRPLSKATIGGYGLLDDIYGNPALILRVDLPRDIYQQGQQTVLYVVISLVAVGVVFGIVIILLLDKAVLSRFFRLGVGLRKIREMGDVSQRLPVTGKDELSNLATDINSMLASLQKSEGELVESEKYQHLFENTLDGILVVDAQTMKVVLANQATAGMFALGDIKEAVGVDPLEFVHPDDRNATLRVITHDTLEKDLRQTNELRVVSRDGKEKWVSAHAVRTQYQGRLAALISLRDITKRKEAEEEVRRLNTDLEQRIRERTAQLQASNQELESFTYSVSHDLRAPLRSITGFSQALLEDYADKLDAHANDYLNRVRAASLRLAQLTDDLLNLSRVTRSEMRHEAVNLTEIAQAVVAELRQRQPERQVEFVVAEGMVDRGDARLIQVVLDNLLGNAWKFTQKRPQAKIEFGVMQHDGETAYFVRDNGAGFDMTYADKLFLPFQRLHAVTEFEGTGIGLATIQRIVRRHGGHAWAEGVVGQGATFYFTLKLNTQSLNQTLKVEVGGATT